MVAGLGICINNEREKLTNLPSRVGEGVRDTISYQKWLQGHSPRNILNFDVLLLSKMNPFLALLIILFDSI